MLRFLVIIVTLLLAFLSLSLAQNTSGASPYAACTIDLCAELGADAQCTFPDTSDSSTCGSWWSRVDGGEKPDCSFQCPHVSACTPSTSSAPHVASNGSRHCSLCTLRQESCESGFEVHLSPPPPPQESKDEETEVRDPVCDPDALEKAHARFCCAERGIGCELQLPTCTSDVDCESSDDRCVILGFGPPLEGRCMESTSPALPGCSVDLCARNGKSTHCVPPDTPKTASTCGAWATRSDGGYAPDCALGCTDVCDDENERLVDNNGVEYCNECALQKASCDSKFSSYGPVYDMTDGSAWDSQTGDTNPAPPVVCKEGSIPPADAARCCSEHSVGCRSAAEECSTAGNRVPPPACGDGLRCVLFDFGVPSADVPNAGECRNLTEDPPVCTISFCAKAGARALCKDDITSDITPCGLWSHRQDGNPRPDCELPCENGCTEDAAVKSDSCNVCLFERKSCRSGFEIHG